MRLGTVVLLVHDLQRSVDFYVAVLGLDVVRREPINDAVHLGPPGVELLSLYDVGTRAPGPTPGATGWFRPSFRVDDPDALDAVAAALRRRDAAAGPESPMAYGGRGPQTRADGLLTVYGQDPDGNRFEVRWQLADEEDAS